MKREEAHIEIDKLSYFDDGNLLVMAVDTEKLVNKIYDDFESRTCENCLFKQEREYQCTNLHINDKHPLKEADYWLHVNKDFGCNKWEAK